MTERATVHSAAVIGVEGVPVTITVEQLSLLPSFQIIGIPTSAMRETRERVRSAIHSSGLQFPRKRITVEVAPAGLMKFGTHLDLPIALAVLASTLGPVRRYAFAVGELGLDGSVRPVRGVFPLVEAAPRGGTVGTTVMPPAIVPAGCGQEAAAADLVN